MGQVMDFAERMGDRPDLFPWVCLGMVILVVIAQHKRILAYFDARIDSYTAKKQSDAVMAELVRNNTAALDNNTAMLSILKQDRHEVAALLENHETLSAERIAHMQTVLNRVDEKVAENNVSIQLLEDRTK